MQGKSEIAFEFDEAMSFIGVARARFSAEYLNKIYEADKNIFTHLKNKLRKFYLAFKDMVKGYENLDKTHRTPYSAELEKLSRDALKRISAAYAEALKVAAGEYQNVELKKTETKAEKKHRR